MPLKDINPALFVVAAEGIAQRGRPKLDTLQVYFLQMVARRARQLGPEFWPRVTERELEYLGQTILTAYQVGVIGDDHVLARAVGITARRNGAAAEESLDASLAQGLRRTLSPAPASRHAATAAAAAPAGTTAAAHARSAPFRETGGGTAVAEPPTGPHDVVPDGAGATQRTPVQQAIAELSGYQLAMMRRDALEAQRAWRRFEKLVADFNPRVIAFIKLAAINETLHALGAHLPDLEAAINEPGKDDSERLRTVIHHARGLGKLLKYQSKTVEESLTFLPDPDLLLRRRQA